MMLVMTEGKELAEVLRKNTALTVLNLGSNNITSEGTKALQNTTLSYLSLEYNSIIQQVERFAKAINENTTLRSFEVNLSVNIIFQDSQNRRWANETNI